MNIRILKFNFIFIILITLSSCGSIKKGIGIDKNPPDEFLITKSKSIKKPPNYDLLPPGSQIEKNKQMQAKKSGEHAKSITDEILNKSNNKTENSENGSSTDLENEILKNIK